MDIPEITILTPASAQYASRRRIRCRDADLEKVQPMIAVPKNADEVATVVRCCVANGVAMTVRGGGTDYFGMCARNKEVPR
jgi:FAD/FMN-containing dehydrogenase